MWSPGGNAGTIPGTNFLGTTDNVALELRANNARVLRLEPASDPTIGLSPNLIGGSSGNTVTPGVVGATIAGGGGSTSICGGSCGNRVAADFGTVGGGFANTAGVAAAVGGGVFNVASGDFSTVPGGVAAQASLFGQMAYASGNFSPGGSGNAQTSLFVLRQVTTGATQTELFLDGTLRRITLAPGRTMTFDILVAAHSTNVIHIQSAGYHIRGVIENASGTTSLIGGVPIITPLGEDDPTWDATAAADDTNDALAIKVTGANGINIRWVAVVRTAEVQ